MFSLIRSALEDGASSGGADDDLKPPPFDSERTLALEGLCTKDGGEVSHVNGLSCCQVRLRCYRLVTRLLISAPWCPQDASSSVLISSCVVSLPSQFPAIPGNLPSKECFPSVDA